MQYSSLQHLDMKFINGALQSLVSLHMDRPWETGKFVMQKPASCCASRGHYMAMRAHLHAKVINIVPHGGIECLLCRHTRV